ALLALRPYYSKSKTIKTACPAKLYVYSHRTETNPVIDKAADFSILLASLKLTDIKIDRKSNIARLLLKVLDKKQQKIYNSLSKTSQDAFEEHIFITQNDPTNFETTLHSSGVLSKTLFEELALLTTIPKDKKQFLSDFFYKIGRLIPLSDALTDWAEDAAKGAYNPILSRVKNENISFEEAYYFYKQEFQRLLYQLKYELKTLQNLDFEDWLNNAFERLERQIIKNGIQKSCKTTITEPILMKNDCDCDCDCDGDSDCCCSCDGCCSCDNCCSCDSCCSCNGCGDNDDEASACSCCFASEDFDSDDVGMEETTSKKKKKKKGENDTTGEEE
ncbi:DUF5685 family protein, partial [Bernardetia sp.]|uniref:DUF5685 family protein n=1 Tax=Bernardetia sp. TaxID=1937974 RepID=UPI0025B89F78